MSETSDAQVVHPARFNALRKSIGNQSETRWMDDTGIDLWQILDQQQETINQLSSQVVDLTDQVEELQAAVENDDYEELTREQKRLRVKKLVQRAAKENGGKGSVDYAELRAVFNKKIPAGSAHYLMEQIAEEEGYRLHKRDGSNNLLKADISETNQEFFSSE